MKFIFLILIYLFIPFNFCLQEESNEKSYLLVNLDRNIKKIYSTDNGNATEELITNLPIELDEINDFAFSNRHNQIFLHQSNRSGIIKLNLTDQEYQIIHDQNTSSINFLTYDELTNKLYWLNDETNNLELGSIDGKIRTTVLENITNVISLAFYSERKELFIGLNGEQSSIMVINLLDKHTDKIINLNISKPNSLTIDKENNLLYWSDADLGTIESVSINNPTIRTNILSNLEQIESLIFKDQMLYWTNLKTSNLYMLNLNDKSKKVMVGPIGDNINLFKKLLVVNNKSSKLFSNDENDELNDFNENDYNDDEIRSFKRSMYLNPYTDNAFIDKYSYIYRQYEPPNIQIDINKFAHSTVRSTEDNNREDISINQISEINFPMNFYFKPIAWHYERFNSSNYLMVDQEQMITIWREPIFNGQSFKFNKPICEIDLRNKGIVSQSIFYTRTINYEQVLQIALIYRTLTNNYKLRAYEITGDSRCLPTYQFDLKNNKPIKLDFISTYQFGSLAVLFEHQQFTPHIEYVKSEHEISTKLVKIYAKQAVDFESFIANGFAYLAIGYSNGVDIFKFDELISRHRLYESIPIYNIKDLKSFSIGFKNFLAIATSGNYQHIFTWKSGSLLRYQILNITNVLQWQIIGLETCRDDLLLGVIRNDYVYPFQLYTWDGINKHFQLAVENIHQYTPHNFIVNPFSQTSFNYNSTAYILEFDRSYKPRLLAIHSSLRQVIDPVFKKLQIVSSKIKSIYNSFVYQQKDINFVKNILDSAVRSTYSVIDANQKFLNNVDIAKSIDINVITKMRRAIWQDTSLTLDDTNLDLTRAQIDINQLSLHTNNLKSILLNSVVLKDQPSTISGNKIFSNGVSVLNKLNSNSIHINKVNNHPLSHLLNDIVYKDSNFVTITGEKIFRSPIDIKGRLDVKIVNDVPDFFELAAKQNVQQLNLNNQINFQNGFTSQNLNLNGLINNLNISNDVIYLDQGPIYFNSPVKIIAFNTTVNSLNTNSINNVDLMNLYRTSLRTNGNQIIGSQLKLKEAITLNNVNVLSNRLNQHNIAYLANVLVRRDQPSSINSRIIFLNSLHLTNNLNILNRFNSLRIPIDLVSKSRSNLITGQKRFNGRIVSVDNLEVKGLINDLKYPQDVVTLTLKEEINSPIMFENGFTTRKNVFVTGRVDGVKINDFAKFINDKFATIPADAQFMGKVFVRNNLIVDGFIGHLNLTSFANNVILKQVGSTLIITGPKLFRNGLEFREGLVRESNGLRISDLVTTNGNETIFTRLKTAAPIQFDNLYIHNRLINNIDLVRFTKNYISIRKPEIVVSNKKFEKLEAMIFLKVKGRVNGLQPNQDFVLNDNVGQINSRVRFTKPITMNTQLNTGNLFVKNSFSNLNIADLLSKRIRLDTNEMINYGIQLVNSSIRHLNLIENKLINGINFNHLRANLLHKFGDQIINGLKRFTNFVQFNGDVRSNSINNISLGYIRDNALRLNGDQVIENNVVFHDDVEVSKLNVGRFLNGVDFSYLLKDGIRFNENVYLQNKTIFNLPTRFLNNVNVNRLNGLNLNKDILHKSGYQQVKSNLIVDELIVKGLLNLKNGYVNNENLFKFENTVLRLDKSNIIKGNLEIDKSVNVLAGTRVNGMINKINLTKIISNSLFKYGDQRLNYARIANVPTTFKKLYSFKVNDVNVRDFMNDIVFANSNYMQSINSPKLFKNMVMRGNYYLPNLNSTCLINGYNLDEMYMNRIPINTNQSIVIFNDLLIRNNLYFNNELKVSGKVNNIDLLTDAIPLNNRPIYGNLIQNINGRKQFKNIIFENQFGIKGILNGANLNELIESTLHKNGKEIIEGIKHFKNKLIFNKLDVFSFNNQHNKQTPFLDYRDLNQNNFRFNQPVEVLGNLWISGKLNNISLNSLYEDSLRYKKPQIIKGKLKFDELIVTKDAKFIGPLNGLDMKQFLNDLSMFKTNERTSALALNKKIYNGIKLSRDLLKYLEHSTLTIEGIQFYQSIDNVFGNKIILNPLRIINTRDNNRIQPIQFNFRSNQFEKLIINYNNMYTNTFKKNHVRREILDDKMDFSIDLPDYDSNEQTIIRKKREKVGTIGQYVEKVQHFDLGNGQILIGSLKRIYGRLELSLLTKNPTNQTQYIKQIGSIQVSAMANNFVIFQIDGEIYLAVSRSFENMCPLQDSGSFIFQWEQRKAFKLIQRINLVNANNVKYYNFNDQHYLIFSNQRSIDGQIEDENLIIYRKSTERSDCQFVLFQKLPFNDVEEYIPFTFGSIDKQELYLIAVSAHKLVLWKHTGHSGFNKYWVADLINGKTVKPVLFNNQLFFIVAQDLNCRGSYVFRAITKGIVFKSIVLNYDQKFRNQINSIPEF